MRSSLYSILLGCVFLLQTQPLFSNRTKLTADSDYFFLKFNWDGIQNQVWLDYNFWCNSFLDWKVENQKAIAHPFFSKRRTAHITSHTITNSKGKLQLSSQVKLYNSVLNDSTAISVF